jgi:hypothetical protein
VPLSPRSLPLRAADRMNTGKELQEPPHSLTIFRGGVVDLKEELEQPPIADFGGIKNDLDGFGVSSVIAVGSVRDISTCIPHPRRDHAVEAAKCALSC